MKEGVSVSLISPWIPAPLLSHSPPPPEDGHPAFSSGTDSGENTFSHCQRGRHQGLTEKRLGAGGGALRDKVSAVGRRPGRRGTHPPWPGSGCRPPPSPCAAAAATGTRAAAWWTAAAAPRSSGVSARSNAAEPAAAPCSPPHPGTRALRWPALSSQCTACPRPQLPESAQVQAWPCSPLLTLFFLQEAF